jgi:protoporphyrinogen oxidase
MSDTPKGSSTFPEALIKELREENEKLRAKIKQLQKQTSDQAWEADRWHRPKYDEWGQLVDW